MMDDSVRPSVGPAEVTYSFCPNCEIAILPGTDHRDDGGCFVALKQFVKLCQDDIENSRMRDFQHPTRDELLESFTYLEDQFEKFVIYATAILRDIKKAKRGTIG